MVKKSLFISVLSWVLMMKGAVLALFLAVHALALPNIMNSISSLLGLPFAEPTTNLYIYFGEVSLFHAIAFVVAYSLWKRHPWARIGQVVIFLLGVMINAMVITKVILGPGRLLGEGFIYTFGSLFGLTILIELWLIVKLFSKSIRNEFSEDMQAATENFENEYEV